MTTFRESFRGFFFLGFCHDSVFQLFVVFFNFLSNLWRGKNCRRNLMSWLFFQNGKWFFVVFRSNGMNAFLRIIILHAHRRIAHGFFLFLVWKKQNFEINRYFSVRMQFCAELLIFIVFPWQEFGQSREPQISIFPLLFSNRAGFDVPESRVMHFSPLRCVVNIIRKVFVFYHLCSNTSNLI